jgi:thiamine-monophosphate kinase
MTTATAAAADALGGIFVPLITPFDADGRVATGPLEALAHEVLDAGAAGIVALGTTAESATLDRDEKHTVLDVCAAVCGARGAALIAGAGSSDTAASATVLAALAHWPQITGALVPVPSYTRPGEAGVLAHFTYLAGRSPVLRSGAGPGDLIAVAGPLGHAAAGLALLEAGLTTDPLVGEHLRPAPPYDAGPEAAGLGATAMIDVSDGLLADLGHIADASGMRVDLDPAALRPGDRLIAAARAVAASRRHSARTGLVTRPAGDLALDWVLTGGEDHSLAATFPAGTRLPPRWKVIGNVIGGHGVVLDGQPWTQTRGWDHFSAG